MSRLCCNWGARTCWRDRFCDWCIPGPAMMCDGTLRYGRKASNYRAALPRRNTTCFERTESISRMKVLSPLIAVALLSSSAFAADPSADRDEQQLAALAKEIQAQQ